MGTVIWKAIPGNEEAFEDLVSVVGRGEATAFVGAGASAERYPLWHQLLSALATEACVEIDEADREAVMAYWKELAQSRPDQAAQQMHDRLGGRFHDLLRARFNIDEPRSTAVHAALARLPFRGYVTLNYDLGLTSAGASEDPPFAWSCRTNANIPMWFRNERKAVPILHAHGLITDATSIVLDQESYRRAYQCKPYLDLLNLLWKGGRLVIVGFGFGDPWLRMTVDGMIERGGGAPLRGPGHFAIIGLAEEDLALAPFHREEVQNTYDGKVVFYPIRDGDHSALQDLLEILAARLAPPVPPARSKAPLSAADVERRWRAAVRRQHRRLHNPLDLPSGMQQLEEAFVAIDIHGDVADRSLSKAPGVSAGLRLADVLDLESASAGAGNRWLLIGGAGSGKTTLLRKQALELAAEPVGGRLPVFVSLPDAVEDASAVLDRLAERFEIANFVESLSLLLEQADRDGRLVLLLDGLDEVPRERHSEVDDLITSLASRFPRATLIVSTRPHGRSDLDGFQDVRVLPLSDESRSAFLGKWFLHRGAEDPARTCDEAIAHFEADSSLGKLSRVPLFLTLLAGLWDSAAPPPGRSSALFERIFAYLYEGRHKERQRPIAGRQAVHRALAFLAHSMTVDEVSSATRAALEDRLLSADAEDTRRPLLAIWQEGLWAFLEDVWERTSILGPRGGDEANQRRLGRGAVDRSWGFWHRTFREYLTSEHLRKVYERKGIASVLAGVDAVAGEPGRWAEPFRLLAGTLPPDDANQLVRRLTDESPDVARGSLESARSLTKETLEKIYAADGDWQARRDLYLAIPVQLDDPGVALQLVEELRQQTRNGNDLFFLDRALGAIGKHWPEVAAEARRRQGALYDHIPTPEDPSVLRVWHRPDGEEIDLWSTIPAGVGWIGRGDGEAGGDHEKPRHRIEIQHDFALSAIPVTNALYSRFDDQKQPRPWKGVSTVDLPMHPRVGVTWYEAVSFCRWLASQPGFSGARLPMEEEWEYACRARTESVYWIGDDEASLRDVGWFKDNADGRSHRVGQLKGNAFDLYDVHGNVWEWTATPWADDRYAGRTGESPHVVGPEQVAADLAALPGVRRVVRGGSYWNTAYRCRSAYRDHWNPDVEFRNQGFRVLLPRPPETFDP